MGHNHNFPWNFFYIHEITHDTHILRGLWWIHDVIGRSNAWNRNINIYHISSCIWWRKSSVSSNSRIRYSGWLTSSGCVLQICLQFYKFPNSNSTNASWEDNREEIKNDSISYGITTAVCAAVYFLSSIFAVDCFNYTAIRQISRIRIKYFQSFVRQEIGWYDVASGNDNFAVRVTE